MHGASVSLPYVVTCSEGVGSLGNIERAQPNAVASRPDHRAVAGRVGELGFSGRPVTYVSFSHTPEDSWSLLAPSMREWAESRAGDPIHDPNTGAATVYWYCRVRPSEQGGPRAAAVTATYDLVMFGKRGLAVSHGSTDAFVDQPGATRWRSRRFDLPVDPATIRHDHRTVAASTPPATATPPTGTTGASARPLLSTEVADCFGNLPLPTQRFLLSPFISNGTRPSDAAVQASSDEIGGFYRERYWCYLVNKNWLAFSYAHRSVPLTSGRSGADLWNGSPEATALQTAPWTLAAWVGRVCT